MSPMIHSFSEILDLYRHVLAQNPGKALVLGKDHVALLNAAGAVRGALFNDRTGMIDVCTMFSFSPGAFQDGHWSGMTVEQTLTEITAPRLLELKVLSKGADPILSSLPTSLLRLVEDSLSNDDVSSYDELRAYFIENGLNDSQADRAMDFRNRYGGRIYLLDKTPILKGNAAEHFDARTSRFVRDGD